MTELWQLLQDGRTLASIEEDCRDATHMAQLPADRWTVVQTFDPGAALGALVRAGHVLTLGTHTIAIARRRGTIIEMHTFKGEAHPAAVHRAGMLANTNPN